MLTIYGNRRRFCDGVARRDFLSIGGLAMGGLSMPEILRADTQAGAGMSHKGVIMVFLAGGPSHQDMFDLKMEAPAEIRGEFKPIQTNVPGIQICEHLPKMAAMMDKLVAVRSLYGGQEGHDAVPCLTGYSLDESTRDGGRPSLGAMLSKLQGPVHRAIPPFVGLSPRTHHKAWGNPGFPGWLGEAHAPVTPNTGDEMSQDMVLNGITLGHLGDRKSLLNRLDRFRRQVDTSGVFEGMDSNRRLSFEILTSSRFVEAMDIEREDPVVRNRYGKGSPKEVDSGPPMYNEQFLMARRLIEAGVRCVTLGFGQWDTHGRNFGQMRDYLPKLDHAVTALVQDLHDRGLDKDISVVAWGEFGRTPKINKDGGRDHWPPVGCGLLAGGGLRTGQLVGSTNRLGEVPHDRPVHYQNVFATLYHSLGIDPGRTTVTNHRGRPMYLLDKCEPLHELI